MSYYIRYPLDILIFTRIQPVKVVFYWFFVDKRGFFLKNMGLPPLFIKVRVDFTRFLTIFIVILGFLPQKTLKLEFNHSFTIVLPQNLEFFVDNFGFNWICAKFFDIFVDKYRFSLSFIHKHFDKTQVHTDFTTKFLIFTTLC